MDSDENGLNNLTLNEGKTSDTANSFYQLLENQAKEFELFGQRLKSEIQNSYQELVKLQQEQSIKSAQEYQTTNHEVNTNFQKNQQIQIITDIAKLGNSQSELIESLKARVEELEIESIVKNQDINNLRQDIKNFLEFNKSKINKKSDIKGKSIDIVNENENYNNLKDYEGAIWADSSSNRSDESSNWENYYVEDENLVNNLKSSKSTHAESSSNSNSNSSSSNSSFPPQINLHIKIQEIIARRENLGKNVRVKHFKILDRDFTSNDLIQYTKSENYNSLNDDIKRIINNYLLKKWSDESSNVEDKIHFKIQEIIARRDNFDKRIRERHFKILTHEFTSNDLTQYTKSENYKSLNDNIKRMINNSFIKRWANDDLNRENHENFKTDDDKSIVQQIHVKIQEIIIRREKIGKTVKRRNLRFLARDFTSDDLIQYTKSGKFKSLNKKIKKIIRDLISSLETTNTSFPLQINSLFQENRENQEINTPLLENLHTQIQQIVTQKEQLGFRVRLKHFKALETFFTINDFIQYTKTNQFNSLDSNSKRLLDLLIYEILTREFNCQNIILSQNLDEYVKRGVIPELPLGYNNYTEYKGSDMFNKLNKFLKERVHKLIKFEEQINVMNMNVNPSNVKPSKSSKPRKRKNTSIAPEKLEKILHFKLL